MKYDYIRTWRVMLFFSIRDIPYRKQALSPWRMDENVLNGDYRPKCTIRQLAAPDSVRKRSGSAFRIIEYSRYTWMKSTVEFSLESRLEFSLESSLEISWKSRLGSGIEAEM